MPCAEADVFGFGIIQQEKPVFSVFHEEGEFVDYIAAKQRRHGRKLTRRRLDQGQRCEDGFFANVQSGVYHSGFKLTSDATDWRTERQIENVNPQLSAQAGAVNWRNQCSICPGCQPGRQSSAIGC